VSSLRTKLERLGSASPARRFAEPARETGAPGSDAALPCERGDLLDSLRDKIARIVAREPAPPPRPRDPSAGELPFVEQSTAHGRLYVRVLAYGLAHRVGRFPIGPARRADMPMLSLLALDPSLAALDPSAALYLDTETTGLAGGTGTLAFLIGLGFFGTDGAFRVEQLLLRRPGEEAPILARVAERLRDASLLVTFNGKAFDAPLVRTRFVMNRMPEPAAPPHLDLLHLARRVHKSRIGACSLGAVESKVLGFGRVDDVPSGEVAARYAHFLRSGDEGALLAVIEHNAWDVVAMAALVSLYGEPLSPDGLAGEDLAGVATTLQRAGSPGLASEIAHAAVERGGGAAALRARALIAKARGDRDRALADFEALVGTVDDAGLRLELAKLYEHHLKSPVTALAVVERGTGEGAPAAERRKVRLARKIEQAERRHAAGPKRARARKRGARSGTLPGMLEGDDGTDP
jgi:uncharacterized protein YprB with RNaseH-like and TPR domain